MNARTLLVRITWSTLVGGLGLVAVSLPAAADDQVGSPLGQPTEEPSAQLLRRTAGTRPKKRRSSLARTAGSSMWTL